MTYTPRNEFGSHRFSKKASDKLIHAQKNGLINSSFHGTVNDIYTIYINHFLAHFYFPRTHTNDSLLTYKNPFQRVDISGLRGLPYGGYARLILLDMMRRARIQKTREICLGMSLGQYLEDLGVHNNGPRMSLIQELLYRFKSTSFCLEERTEQSFKGGVERRLKTLVLPVFDRSLGELRVVLSQGMLTLACSDGYPIDFRIFSRLVKNTLAFDLMLWLTWCIGSLSKTDKPSIEISLETLGGQFYPSTPDFDQYEFKRKLRNNVKILFEINSELEKFISFDARGNVLVITNTPNQR